MHNLLAARAQMGMSLAFRLVEGHPVDIHPLATFTNLAALHETIHMTYVHLGPETLLRAPKCEWREILHISR